MMLNRTKYLSSILLLLASATSASAAENLPVREGAYLTELQCKAAELGELDGVPFSIAKGGRQIGLLESSCIVASVQDLRPNRYAVTADCLEMGEPWEYSFILDDLGDDKIRIDGEDYARCTKGFLAEGPSNEDTLDLEAMTESWFVEEQNCRGGSGDDPSTFEACERRGALAEELHEAGFCYGMQNQSRAEFEWHGCVTSSVR